MKEPAIQVICKRKGCRKPYSARLVELHEHKGKLTCPHCGKQSAYNINDTKLLK
jgi:transposase